jgi:BASS family bile acid:Na+ symporter
MLSGLLNVAVLVFSVSSMLSVGFGFTPQDLIRPLQDVGKLSRALIANFMAVPTLAYVIGQALGLAVPLAVGLMLLGMAAGAPFLIKLTEVADHDIGSAARLLVLLLPLTVIYLPLMVPLVVPGATVSVNAVGTPLLLSMLLPLAIGVLTRTWFPQAARRLQPTMGMVATIALLVLIAFTLVVNFQQIIGLLGTGGILAAALLIIGAFAIGFLLGGPDPGDRGVLGLGTGQRNVAAATVVATQSIGDPDTLAVVVSGSVIGMSILFPIAWRLERNSEARVWDVYDRTLTGRG